MLDNLANIFTKAAEEAVRERGHANVLIAGRTGVGKSTLINCVFQGEYATVGHGRPITQNTRAISREGVPLTIYDTRGLELDSFDETRDELRRFVGEQQKEKDQNKHIHVAWVCISEDLRRVETAESALVKSLAEVIPVVGVITKSRADNGFRSEVQSLLPAVSNVLRVRAMDEIFDDGHRLPSMGLAELVTHTLELFPEGQRRAFVAAQKIDLKLKKSRSRKIVMGFAAGATVMGANPIPMTDAMGLAALYIAMFSGVTATYGMSFSQGFLTTLTAAAVGTPAASLSAPLIVGSLLKFFPGVGTITGGVIVGSVAASLAMAIGMAYIEILHRLFEANLGDPPDPTEVVSAVKKHFEKANA
jgi:predicted GTPase/uncharacterized protein (DUF697 family)